MQEFITNNLTETHQLGARLLSEGKPNVWLLEGELGAGKTAFSQGVLACLGAARPFTSPTFVIMKKYVLPREKQGVLLKQKKGWPTDFENVYHLDCYRVEAADILALGWEELAMNPRNLILVEWPEKMRALWPSHYLQLKFEVLGEERRRIRIEEK